MDEEAALEAVNPVLLSDPKAMERKEATLWTSQYSLLTKIYI